MHLYLASYHFGPDSTEFADLFGSNRKVAVIANSLDVLEEKLRLEKVENNYRELKEIGLQPIEVDLREYFGKVDQLRNKLNEFGGVWVRGGNTFILRRAMQYSGMDQYLIEKVKSDFVYGGYSAGVCVLAIDLHGIEIVDDPHTVPVGYKPEIIWDGIGLIQKMIIPHYKSNHPESYLVDKTVEWFEENNLPFETLRDGEAVVREITK